MYQKNFENKKIKKLFIICPLGEPESPLRDRSDKVKRNIIDPVAEEKGYKTYRSELISKPGNINYEIIQHLSNDELVVVDITDHNANVFYELAVRHATQKPVILIGEEGWNPPFDISHQRVIHYKLQNPDSVREAKDELNKQIQSVESGEFIVDSPIKMSILIDLALKNKTENPEFKAILSLLQNYSEKLSKIENALQLRAVVLPAETAVRSSYKKIEISIEPEKGPVGMVARVTSYFHTAGSPISFYFDAVRQGSLLEKEIALSNGTCVCKIIIPNVMKGTHYIWVKDENTGQTGVVPFEII